MEHATQYTLTNTVLALLYFCAGALLWLLFSALLQGEFLQHIAWCYEKVGVTFVALLPLGIWGIWTALQPDANIDRRLAYIGATAQRFGLLGTVIGIVAATIRIGNSIDTGAAVAVTSALPAVGQALVSTAVGFSIAIICDFFRYLHDETDEKRGENNPNE